MREPYMILEDTNIKVLVFRINTPVMRSIDTRSHISRAYVLTEGKILNVKNFEKVEPESIFYQKFDSMLIDNAFHGLLLTEEHVKKQDEEKIITDYIPFEYCIQIKRGSTTV